MFNDKCMHCLQVGIRKSIFSDTEKQVTSTVIQKREQTAQEIAESQLNQVNAIGSNTQLNTGELLILIISWLVLSRQNRHQFGRDSFGVASTELS